MDVSAFKRTFNTPRLKSQICFIYLSEFVCLVSLACGKSELLFYVHFTEAQCQILLPYVIMTQLCNKKMKSTIRILWREIANEPAGIYEQGIILVEV